MDGGWTGSPLPFPFPCLMMGDWLEDVESIELGCMVTENARDHMDEESSPRPSASHCLVTVATYNEMENLPRLTEQILGVMPDLQLLVVDDNSPDGTGQWAAGRAAEDPRIHHLGRPGKEGLGSAIVAAMRWAIEREYEYLINLDGDFSHDPRQIPQFLEAMEPSGDKPSDLVIGSRYIPGGKIEGWPWRRYWMSRGVNWYTRRMLGTTIADCSSGYRCYRVTTLARMPLDQIRSTGYSFHEEFLWHLAQAGGVCREVPIHFIDRTEGESKINLREGLVALKVIAQLGFRRD
jgi:dolichol-phosphate mannosyltransferase